MKKRSILITTSIIICLILVVILSSKEKFLTFKSDGVTYALTVNGVKQNSFPKKGLYRVDTECVNATCKWDYDAWKLYMENITGDITCNISFTTLTKNSFNNYIIGLSGTTQGTGQVVHETFIQGIYTNATTLTQSEYGATSQFYNQNYWSTTGTSVTNAFSYSGTEWVSEPSNLTSGTNYHITFTVPSDGYYQFCYELSSGSSNNNLILYKGTSQVLINGLSYLKASSSNTQSGCTDLGSVTSGTQFRVVQYAYSTISTIKFNLKKAGSTQTFDTGYRYEGKNPNNWVWFNNELWRIIGVFDEETHGQAGLNLIKMIRANSIGGLVWQHSGSSGYGTNDWTNSSLYKLLNPVAGDTASGAYYNKQNGNGNAYCYSYYINVPGNCDYRNIGIGENYRRMIKSVTWKVGGNTTTSATAENFYLAERGSATGNNNAYAKETTGYIGLMYPSDYGYSVLSSSCTRTTTLVSYNTSSCAGQSWLGGQGYEWTLTPNSSSSYMLFVIFSDSNLNHYYANHGLSTRPSLYLDDSVYLIDGTGTETDPYIIGM